MKKFKKAFAIVLALAVVLSMSVAPTFAASVSMEIASTDTHEYKVYQIYTGDLSEDGKTLSNVKYGNSGYGTAGAAVPKSELDGVVADGADAFARKIADDCITPVGTLKAGNTSIDNLAPGYYLIVDDTEKELVDGDSYSAYIVEILKTTTIKPKKDITESDKKITTDTLGKDEATTTVNGVVDNVSIGDTVNFEITGTVPSHATDYDYYFYIIGDTLTDGLTFNPQSVKVSASTKGDLTEDTDYALYTGDNADGKTFQVALTNAKALAGQTITVTYSATLNEKAQIGELSNDNTVVIEYSNNPNHDYDGDKDVDNPGKPASESNSPLGETPEIKTQTYTTGIQIQKVDEEGNVLTGAEFTVTGDNEEIVLVSDETFAEDTEGTYYKLKNGTYTTQDPVNADYMKPAAAGATAGYVEDATYDGEDKEIIEGKTYRPYNSATDAEATVYVLVKANADQYESTEVKYKKTIKYTQKNTNASGVTATAEVGADGVVIFNGLGAGEYTITESKTPDGYNTIAPITFTIAFKANPETGAYHWSTTSNDASYNPATGEFELTIENKQGAELPSTGGIGTTIFYVLGALLVVGAGVLLVTRRRMKTN